MGFTALRGNSIFATSVPSRARIYGTLYIIFPIDGFDFTYCVGEYDLELPYAATPDSLGFQWLGTEDPEAFLQDYLPRKDNLAQALKEGYEVYIRGQYYALRQDLYLDYVSAKMGINPPDETLKL